MKCQYDPSVVHGPIGMFHCPECGEMVVVGMPHPDYDHEYNPDDFMTEEEMDKEEES